MNRIEGGQIPEVQVDPLRDVRKYAANIMSIAEQKDLKIDINIFGALHVGIPDNDIVDQIAQSNLTTVELPSNAVNAFKKKEHTYFDDNTFWVTVVENSRAVAGVNNNRGAVNGIRVLDARVRKGQVMPDFVPDLVMSRIEKEDSDEDTKMVDVKEKSFLDGIKNQEVEFHDQYPSLAWGMMDGKGYFVQVNRNVPEESASVLYINGKYMMPFEYQFVNGQSVFGEMVGGIPGSDAVQYALSHLIRTRVDKTQVDGMLKTLQRAVKQADPNTEISLTHVGGAAHNPNLIAILNEAFTDQSRVQVRETLDSRMPKDSIGSLTFFSKYISIADALSATEIVNDMVVVDYRKVDQIFKKIARDHAEELSEFGYLESFAQQYEESKYINKNYASDNAGQVEFFTVRSLLSLVNSNEVFMIRANDEYPEKLAMVIMQNHPELEEEVLAIMNLHEDRKFNFPKAKTDPEPTN